MARDGNSEWGAPNNTNYDAVTTLTNGLAAIGQVDLTGTATTFYYFGQTYSTSFRRHNVMLYRNSSAIETGATLLWESGQIEPTYDANPKWYEATISPGVTITAGEYLILVCNSSGEFKLAREAETMPFTECVNIVMDGPSVAAPNPLPARASGASYLYKMAIEVEPASGGGSPIIVAYTSMLRNL
jgi:hypothetical protein